MWAQSASKADEAQQFLKSGLEANPTSFLLNFAYSELCEQSLVSLLSTPNSDSKKVEEKKQEGHDLYKKFIGLLKKELDDLEAIHISEGGTPISIQTSGSAVQAQVAAPAPAIGEDEDDEAMKENEIYGIVDPAIVEAKAREAERLRQNEQREASMIDKRTELGQVSIAWMRYARRVAGSQGLRNVFKEVRGDKWVCWWVFEAAGE